MKESELIFLLQSGDENALKELFLRFGKTLRYFAYGYVKNIETAEELVEDVYLKLWQLRTQFESINKIQAFLYVSLKNTCINNLKSPKNNKIKEDISTLENILFKDEDILERLINIELIHTIFNEIEKLSPKQQKVFKLSFMEGLTIEEIAAEMQISTNAVYTNRFRAVQHLREKLGIEESFFTLILSILFLK